MTKSAHFSIFLATAALVAGPFVHGPAAAGDLDARVERAALGIYVHGMTAEIAHETVGPEGVPVLLRLLADPTFPRRDNVAAYLAYLGDDGATPHLLDLYAQAPGGFDRPEDRRAAIVGLEALGRIAGRGGERARTALLETTGRRAAGGFIEQAFRAGRVDGRLRDALYESAVRALALSGDAELLDRLDALAAGAPGPAADVDLGADARAHRVSTPSTGSTGSTGSDAGAPAAVDLLDIALDDAASPHPPTSPRAIDTAPRCDESFLTYANHADLLDPMDDARLDQVLWESNFAAGREDSNDVACCVRLARQGGPGTWSTAGEAVITTQQEIQSVLSNSVARVKVVDSIQYCSGPGSNIIGCAPVGGYGMAVVRLSGALNEGLLWMHEYGHNTGLGHNPSSGYVMSGGLTGSNVRLSAGECGQFHSPSFGAQATIADCGVCEDDDGDGYVSSIDNCPEGAPGPDEDGDGFGGDCDCAPANPGLYSSPEGIDTLVVDYEGSDLILSWSTPASAGPSPRYQIVGSFDPADWSASTCLGVTGAPGRTLPGEVPGSGSIRFYFVRGLNFCGVTLDDGLGGQAQVPAGVCG